MWVKINKGITLFEVLISLAILSILIIISYLMLPSLISRAYDARRKTDLGKIKNYLENYYNNANYYPKDLPDCSQLPCDPVTHEPYYYQIKSGEPQSYRVYAMLANNQDDVINKIGCRGGCGPDCKYNYGVSSTNVGLVRCSYVCAPGGGGTGSCELFNDPSKSLCTKLYYNDATCNNECGDLKNRCKNSSGKNISY